MSDGKTALWTPDGVVVLGGSLERVELKAGVMEWLRQFADVADALQLHVRCNKCEAALVGKNADSDRTFSVACGCKEWIGPNREYRPSAVH